MNQMTLNMSMSTKKQVKEVDLVDQSLHDMGIGNGKDEFQISDIMDINNIHGQEMLCNVTVLIYPT